MGASNSKDNDIIAQIKNGQYLDDFQITSSEYVQKKMIENLKSKEPNMYCAMYMLRVIHNDNNAGSDGNYQLVLQILNHFKNAIPAKDYMTIAGFFREIADNFKCDYSSKKKIYANSLKFYLAAKNTNNVDAYFYIGYVNDQINYLDDVTLEHYQLVPESHINYPNAQYNSALFFKTKIQDIGKKTLETLEYEKLAYTHIDNAISKYIKMNDFQDCFELRKGIRELIEGFQETDVANVPKIDEEKNKVEEHDEEFPGIPEAYVKRLEGMQTNIDYLMKMLDEKNKAKEQEGEPGEA